MTWSILHLPSISNPSKHTFVSKKVLELRCKLNKKWFKALYLDLTNLKIRIGIFKACQK
jgi:hypothetical protein